jgi:hypothetical protein
MFKIAVLAILVTACGTDDHQTAAAPSTVTPKSDADYHRKILGLGFDRIWIQHVISKNSPLRLPSKPALAPATLMSWQGNPP